MRTRTLLVTSISCAAFALAGCTSGEPEAAPENTTVPDSTPGRAVAAQINIRALVMTEAEAYCVGDKAVQEIGNKDLTAIGFNDFALDRQASLSMTKEQNETLVEAVAECTSIDAVRAKFAEGFADRNSADATCAEEALADDTMLTFISDQLSPPGVDPEWSKALRACLTTEPDTPTE